MILSSKVLMRVVMDLEREAISLHEQADQHGIGNAKGNALLTAAYVAGTLRNIAVKLHEEAVRDGL